MQERHVHVATPDGNMETFVAHPDGAGPFPAVVMFQNVGGLSEILRGMARRLAAEGYYCAVPSLYHRLGTIVIDPDSKDEKVLALRKIASGSLVNGKVVEDTGALLKFITTDKAARSGPMGTIGYCQGGRFAVLAAANFPGEFKATASLFGTQLITKAADSPHLVLNKMQGEVYFGFAEHDHSAPPETVEQIRADMRQCPVKSLVEVHPDTQHGYAFPGRVVYHKEAAELSWKRIFEMFQRQIRA